MPAPPSANGEPDRHAPEALRQGFEDAGYIADNELIMAISLTFRLDRPLLLEGETGVGKTEVAKTLAKVLDCPLIRLQCYEGLDANAAVYEWNYQRQLLAIKIWETEDISAAEKERHVFEEEFLLRRPLLQAISMEEPPVLLIDEIDRSDEEFEAYLLEVLSEFQITIPELGTIEARSVPHVILTSNRSRELSDALRRRCLYHFVDYPTEAKELRIVTARVPEMGQKLAAQVVRFVQALRQEGIDKKPGIAETLDWAHALTGQGIDDLAGNQDVVEDTLLCLLKTKEDRDAIPGEVVGRIFSKAV
ncbi:MAG: MoxR family ATPase [Proteobacteria bacterium]|nr:MoxR family ATPase [Pseudomonadota bacterium]